MRLLPDTDFDALLQHVGAQSVPTADTRAAQSAETGAENTASASPFDPNDIIL